jgi:hypothetical protein
VPLQKDLKITLCGMVAYMMCGAWIERWMLCVKTVHDGHSLVGAICASFGHKLPSFCYVQHTQCV